jgi:hypothetical protein
VATLPPELADGAEPELKPPEFCELELLEEPAPEEPAPEPAEEKPDPDEDAELDPDVPDCEAAVLCAAPGSTRATAPAVTTLAIVTAVVADRTLARPRSRAAMAWRTVYRCALLISPILRSRAARAMHEASRFALSPAVAVPLAGEA